MENTTVTAAPTVSATPLTLAQKLAAKKADQLTQSATKANRVSLNLDYDKTTLSFSIPISRFVDGIKKSSTGDSEGLMVSLAGKFDYEVDGETYTFEIYHPKGGAAWVSARMEV